MLLGVRREREEEDEEGRAAWKPGARNKTRNAPVIRQNWRSNFSMFAGSVSCAISPEGREKEWGSKEEGKVRKRCGLGRTGARNKDQERTGNLLAVVEVQRLHARGKFQLRHVTCDRWEEESKR